jgi:uncharacterized Zn-binding protein involved in type VI secretion
MDHPNNFSAEENFRQRNAVSHRAPRFLFCIFHANSSASARVRGSFLVMMALLFFGATDARPQMQGLTPSGPITLVGKNGVLITGMRVTSTTGNCISIENSSNIVIERSEIGPCGDPAADDMGNGIFISGSQKIEVSDNYIHVDNPTLVCCDKRDNVLVEGSSNVAIQGNVIAYGETNIEINEMPSDHVSVIVSSRTKRSVVGFSGIWSEHENRDFRKLCAEQFLRKRVLLCGESRRLH